MRLFLLMLASTAAFSLRAASDKPVPVVDEPMHKVVFENSYVRILDVQIPKGVTTLYHMHVIPSVIVYLTKSTNRSESWPDKAILTRDIAPGQSRYAPYDQTPLTHRVTNTGDSLFRVFDIELLKKPTAVTLAPLKAANATQHWDEKLVRSSGIKLAANGKTEIPASSCALLVVGIRGAVQVGSSAVKSPAGRTLKWGEYQFFEPQTRLEIKNTAPDEAEAVVLELKG